MSRGIGERPRRGAHVGGIPRGVGGNDWRLDGVEDQRGCEGRPCNHTRRECWRVESGRGQSKDDFGISWERMTILKHANTHQQPQTTHQFVICTHTNTHNNLPPQEYHSPPATPHSHQ